jgi:nucleotide-binding universal stress UspA family protein
MTEPPRRVLAVADADAAQLAFETAAALADAQGAALEVLACVEPPHDLSILARLAGAEPDALIADAVARTRDAVGARLAAVAPGRPVALTVAVGKAYLEVVRHVARTGCDFVVKRAEPLSGMERFLLASTDQHLLRKCPCPVWLQVADAPRTPARVLAAVDLDIRDEDEPETLAGLNRRVVETACRVGGPEAEIVVLHAWDAVGAGMAWAFSGQSEARLSADRYVNEVLDARQAAMARLLAEMRAAVGPRPRLVPRLARGAPETVIHAQAREAGADLVVMGTVARTGLAGVFIGNTAENIVNGLDRAVLAVKPEGFVSPLLRG